jgi:type IV pilus assembly protein PilB
MNEKKRLGELLIEAGFITPEQLNIALEEQKRSYMRLGEILLQKGFINEDQLSKIIAEQLGSATMDLNLLAIKPQTIRLIPKEICITHKVLPIIKSENTITLAMSDPYDVVTQDLIKMITSCNIKVVVCKESDIINAIQHFYPEEAELEEVVSKLVPSHGVEILKDEEKAASDKIELKELKIESEAQPIVKLVNSIIVDAIKMRASDIHLEHSGSGVQVRYRIDGLLRKVATLPSFTNVRLVSRIKIIGGMDIAETRAPQDGRCRIKFEKKEYDLRISTIPTYYGEKIVMRVLNKSAAFLALDKIGLMPEDLAILKNAINNKQGIILSTGPTGSGKSSTLFSLIDQIRDETKNIVTLEDPIEYDIEGINQVQVNERAGITFANGLRSILRQDPDVIMVGEIRDAETAKIAFNAAMTGHLVLSTLHTNDAPTAITRLLELEVSPFLLTAALKSVIAQRLVRRVCEMCKESYFAEDEVYTILGLNPKNKVPFYRGRGCENCQFTGYYGRIGILKF